MTIYNSYVLQGGVNDDVTITAYITAAFLELGNTVQVREWYNFYIFALSWFCIILYNIKTILFMPWLQDPIVNKGLLCLKSAIGNLTNTYTTALLAYTFSLAGEKDFRGQLLKKLDGVAVGGMKWVQ